MAKAKRLRDFRSLSILLLEQPIIESVPLVTQLNKS